MFLNRKDPQSSEIPETEQLMIVEKFLTHLRLLVGLPSVDELFTDVPTLETVVASNEGVAEWELDHLARRRTWENINSASTDLVNLVELTQTLTNMVILDNIQHTVEDSLRHIETVTISITNDDAPFFFVC